MNGGASIHLTPIAVAAAAPRPQAARPTPAEIAEWSVHPSRTPVTREVLNSAMCTVQKQLKLQTGLAGEWTPEATARLRENLAKPKKGSSGASTWKETLRGEIKELLEAIQVHQEIEEENEELKAEVQDLTPLIKVCDSLREKIDRLEEENLYLRQMLTG
ncbi:unnamed protein product [Cladocopium goreaui]|uniref:Uncharacterized protein n=1 Tax=Cladocopium goreaui TaxID=2562237 RepID=A0A9P1GE63_9DINO|nr:unnamed protein product [Cladocopium goreaui]